MVLGLALDFVGLDAVKMLFTSAVLNGVLAPPLIVILVLLTSNQEVMGEHTNSKLLGGLGWTCAAVMTGAAVLMFATWQ
jgi:Mn2+/Fe2+ NRAMP family transporter